MKMELIVSSETSAIRTQTPGNYPKRKDLRDLSREGYMRSMQWQFGVLGTISAFAFWHRETKKKLCRGGRSQDLPDTDF